MNNRFVRWTVYFVVGIVIGVGVSYFHKQQKIDEGVVALTPDEVREEGIETPSRHEETVMEAIQEAEEAVMEGVQEIEETVIEDVKEIEAVMEGAMDAHAKDELEETIPSEKVMSADEAIEETAEEIVESVEENAKEAAEAVEEAAEEMEEEVPQEQEAQGMAKEALDAAATAPEAGNSNAMSILTPMPE